LNMRKEYTALLRESVRRFVAQNWQVSSGNYMPRNKNGLVTFDEAITRIIDTPPEDPSEHNVTLLYLVGYESESAAFKSWPLDTERFAEAFLNSYGITLVSSVEKAAGLVEKTILSLKTKAKGVKGLTYFLRHAHTKNIARPINNALSKRGWQLAHEGTAERGLCSKGVVGCIGWSGDKITLLGDAGARQQGAWEVP
jgi:hypothetical protein